MLNPMLQALGAQPQFQNLSPQVQTMAQSQLAPDPMGRPVRPDGERYIKALRGVSGTDANRSMTPEWAAYNQQLDAWRIAQRGMHGHNKHDGGDGMPLPAQMPPGQMPGQAQQIAPAMPNAFAPPGMAGTSYMVRGMNPGATPFDLPTY